MFENIQKKIVTHELKEKNNFDSFLSGSAVTVIVKKDKTIYTANVGNVLAFIFYSEKKYSYKYKIKTLSLDDSSFRIEQQKTNMGRHNSIIPGSNGLVNRNGTSINLKDLYNDNLEIKDKEKQNNIHGNFDMNEELRRIYENGGEVRKLSGENNSRIFVKGKYFPGLINTRSIGDEIGNTIGISHFPHVGRYNLSTNKKYHLILCTDGISNVVKSEQIVNIFEQNDNCIYF
jgi:serine/threonine protein phosphatase PrpC